MYTCDMHTIMVSVINSIGYGLAAKYGLAS